MKQTSGDGWSEWIGQTVVLDIASPYVYLGRLVRSDDRFLLLEEVDVHDLRDTAISREKYVLDSRRDGIRANRHQAWVALREIVGISKLDDVVLY